MGPGAPGDPGAVGNGGAGGGAGSGVAGAVRCGVVREQQVVHGGWQFLTTKSKGTHSLAAVWHPAGQWHDQSAGLAVPSSCGRKCFRPGSLSCGSPVNCMEFSRYANLAWNGTGLRPAPSVSAGRGSLLGAVSCGTSYCMAVGHKTVKGKIRPLAELWNGTTWTIIKTP